MPKRPLILIVDDNLDAREMYGLYLEHEGFRWAEAVNGHDALMQTKLEKPALINQLILDFLAETTPPGTMFPMRRA